MEDHLSLPSFFSPRSIAVIGASRDPQSVGTTILDNIIHGNFKGSVYPINPKATEISGLPCYPSVESVSQPIDLCIIAVPSTIVPIVLEQAGKKNIPYAVIISSGFKETGPSGLLLEQQLTHIAKKYNIHILGPNCLGIIHPHIHLNASFAKTSALPGSIAFVSQSGAIGTAMLDFLNTKNIGLSHFISVGNESDLTAMDFIKPLSEDEKTSVIGIYLEQIPYANKFLLRIEELRKQKNIKPMVILKAGLTTQGSAATKSHTGALSGSNVASSTLFHQAGILMVETIEEFIDTLTAFSQNPPSMSNTVTIITNAGGPGVLAVDTAISHDLTLFSTPSYTNPNDIHGDAKVEDFSKALIHASKDETGNIFTIITPQTTTDIAGVAHAIIDAKKTIQKPFVVCSMGQTAMEEATQLLQKNHITTVLYPENGIIALSHLWHWHQYAQIVRGVPKIYDITRQQTAKETFVSMTQSKKSLFHTEALDLLRLYGIPTPSYIFASSKEKLLSSISQLADTVVLKILSPDIVHKTESKAIALNIPKNTLAETYDRMMKTIAKHYQNARIEGVLCMDFVPIQDGFEMIIGIKQEPNVGKMIMIGAGGIMVELMKDVSFRFTPITPKDASMMIDELNISPLFTGFRGKQPLDKEALVDMLCRISQLVTDFPAIQELDCNPLVVFPKGKGVTLLDARILL